MVSSVEEWLQLRWRLIGPLGGTDPYIYLLVSGKRGGVEKRRARAVLSADARGVEDTGEERSVRTKRANCLLAEEGKQGSGGGQHC